MHIDVARLTDSIDAYTVARYIGIDVIHKGKYKFILCPGHEMRTGSPDTNASNCVLTEKGYHCFACNQTVGMINMIMEYLNVPYKDAIVVLAEAAGGIELFKGENKPSTQSVKMPLTEEELSAIGLSLKTHVCFYKNKSSEVDFEDDENIYTLEDKEILVGDKKTQGMSLNSIYRENRKLYNKIIYDKATMAIARYDEALEAFGSRGGSGAKLVFELFSEDGSISSETFAGIKNALKRKKTVAYQLQQQYKEE